nr:hypothetical protein [Tanacetum cinerariifolium]GEY53634.1 hypothetical protein [Tanacetum cinerariifolium]
MTFSREWMYQIGTSEFYDGIEEFMKQADSFARSKGFVDRTVQCPCNSCKNLSWKGIEDAKYDLYRYGFVPNYYVWDKHGEQHSQRINRELPNRAKAVNIARNMVINAAGSQFEDLIFEAPTPLEPPNPTAKRAEECEARPLYRWIHAFWDVIYLIFLLANELYVLWKDGVDSYDAFRERNFNLKAALMWIINDFPAYGMLSGWSTHGRLSCPRHELELVMEANGNTLKPKALYTLNKEQKKVVLQWVKTLKFPDGYASNLSRCVDLQRCKMWGMKSHDCHVFMERLLPNAFREMLPEPIWKAMTEKKVKNKARLESSIGEAYILEEISNFRTRYFESHVETDSRRVGRNDDGGNLNPNRFSLSIFNHPGRPSGTCKQCYLDDDEYAVATFYVLQNCDEMQPFIRKFEAELKVKMPNVTSVQLIHATEERFGRWIRDYVLNPLNSNLVSDNLKSLAIGPSRHTRTWQLYYVNGFNFHTMHHSFGRKTSNTDLCIVGEEGDYYGQLNDVIELEYMNCSKVVLFKCEWFDPVKHRGWKIHNEFGLVDINHKKKLRNYDPFIMAHQAQQVYFISYPSMRKDKNDWWAVCRTKARSTIVAPTQPIDSAYQEDGAALPFLVTENDEVEKLHDDEGDMELVEVQHLQDHESEEVEDLIEEEESNEEEELEYEYGSDEDNEAKEKDEWLDNF